DLASLAKLQDAVAIAKDSGLHPEVVHLAASAAAADLPETRLDMVRVGIIAYGVSPFDDRSAKDLGFQPVMSVHARVISRDDHSATLGMGFGDGLIPPRSGEGWLVHQGVRYSISAVEADHTVIVGGEGKPLPEVGDEVTLWGQPDQGSPLAEDWAAWAGTIGDEIVASLGAHVPRRFIDETGDAG
ncbi:MAG: alanine racemase C-terminal domain-containing protein, partial [Pontimonas sp.]